MKILITGANGFMGHGIIKELSESGNEIVVSDFTDFTYGYKNVSSIAGNLFEIENPFAHFGKPDVLVHLAWRDGFKHASDNHILDLPKHYEFLKKMVTDGVKKLVVLGSMHEVGFHEGSINENTPCNPLSLYGIAKNALRQMTELLVKNTETRLQWVRGFYIVDNTVKGCSIFSKIMQAAADGKKTFPFTSGINQFDFLDFNVFCKQVAAVVLNDTVFGTINACCGKPETLASRVERFIKENNLDIKLEYGAFPDRPYDSLAIWGDNTKIKKILGED
ncbi:NAD(P)-dependent oxidoreductase [uncultured Treponema sp.]|uniref:NAD-dependent epimerase/dehydratase family protein n=1 Tax=uncultured Treponema sp. TaxID=162155 RepID=UPI0025FEA338|nr:NAD(P)-dependent oxidoreductase [uncultured Treponema sp.]